MPLGTVLHNSSGSIRQRQSPDTVVGPRMAGVVAPVPQHQAGMAERREQRLIKALVTQER